MRLFKAFAIALLCTIIPVHSASVASETPDCDVSWQAYRLLNKENTGSTPDKNDVETFIAFTVTITQPADAYLYGPKATSVGLPTKVALHAVYAGQQGEQSISVLAPKTSLIHETRFGKEGQVDGPAIYADAPTFLAYIPVKSLPFKINGQISGLICSDVNCTPFKKFISTPITKEIIDALPEKSTAELMAGLEASESTEGGIEEDVTAGGGSVVDRDGATDYSFLSPQYFKPNLEVQELGSALLFGLISGLLLNLMPCVLPVISLKFSSLLAVTAMSDKKQQAHLLRAHCLLFAAGIIIWFIILSLLLGVAGLAWGQMFQSPEIISILGLILFLLSLSLFGVFCLPIFDLKVKSSSNPYWQAFASGLLATLLATPCSGPLLGGVLSWALRQPLAVLILCVASVGLGMALPYCIMAFCPRLVHLLPKPGNWTIKLEQLLGFFLMGSVVYLMTLLPPDWVLPFLMNLIGIAFAAWLWGQIGHLGASTFRRITARTLSVFVLGGTLWLGAQSIHQDFAWEPFDPLTFSALIGKEDLMVEFTADWCPSCKAIEHTTLNEKRMARLRKQYGMRTIKVDLTRQDKAGTELLKALGSTSLPVMALFPKGEGAKSPLVMRDIITPSQLKEALKRTFSH